VHRFISTILAILVLALSCIPCSDVVAMPSSLSEQLSIKAATEAGCDHHEADMCTPFCTCSCCAGFTIPVATRIVPALAASYADPAFGVLKLSATSAIAIPVWQPPKRA